MEAANQTTPVDQLAEAVIEYFSGITNKAKPLTTQSEKTDTQIQLAVETFAKNSENRILFDSRAERFIYYDLIRWHTLDRRLLGLYLRDYAINLGCNRFALGNFKGIEGLLKQAEYELLTEIAPTKKALNFPNGTLEIDTLKFREHKASDYFFWVLPYEYDPTATAPKWRKFISEVLDVESTILFQEVVGYTFTELNLEKTAICNGNGRNGKSTALGAIGDALGKENICNYNLSQITEPSGVYRAGMEGKLLNLSEDNGQKISDFGVFKSFVSGEELMMKKLYQQPYLSRDYPKAIFATNNLPIVEDFSGGYFRRLLIINWNYTVPDEATNISLSTELKEESAGILNWIIEGAVKLKKQRKFSECQSAKDYLLEYRRDSDAVSLWVESKGLSVGVTEKTKLNDLYTEASEWLFKNGFSKMSSRTFAGRLRQLGFKVEKGGGGWQYISHGAKPEEVPPDGLPF